MATVTDELPPLFSAYLARLETEVGPAEAGAYVKVQGRLVRRLTVAEFSARWSEFEKIEAQYRAILERGDTISDALLKLLRERSAELVLARTY